MKFYDVFNGDADGICALHQFRLAYPREAALVSGVKRDIRLLGRVDAAAGDEVSVFDISLDVNREALVRTLAAGARVQWFDHHHAGEIPAAATLRAYIDTDANVCTSLIVDRHLQGRFRKWAVVAAFGDNLERPALAAAAAAALSADEIARLRTPGVCMNYNAYGETVEDLMFAPAELYARLRPFDDPADFLGETRDLERLQAGRQQDLIMAAAQPVERVGDGARAVVLPDAAWSRRVIGEYANTLASEAPALAHTVLVRRAGGYLVSLRAPLAKPAGAVALARGFASGGGREGAAGIDLLRESDVDRLLAALREAYPRPAAWARAAEFSGT